METKKLRFQDAQVGDEVYSMIHGDCIIVGRGEDLVYTSSKDHDFIDTAYNINGNYFHDIGEPILFYRKGSEKYLTERPEPKYEVDWAKVEEGTEIEVYCPVNNEWRKKIFYAYAPSKKYPIQTKLTEWLELQLWEKARLIND